MNKNYCDIKNIEKINNVSEKLKQLYINYRSVKMEIGNSYGLNVCINNNTKYEQLLKIKNEIRDEKKRINRSTKFKILLDEK